MFQTKGQGDSTTTMNMTSNSSFILGIDLGTTSIKVVLLDSRDQTVAQTFSQATNANVVTVSSSDGTSRADVKGGSEQDVAVILRVMHACLQKLDHEKLGRVSHIGVTGQMHGIMLWKGKPWFRNDKGIVELVPDTYSRLYTWQDGRCTDDFLSSLPKPKSHLRLATGHGCASLFWLQRYQLGYVERFDRAGTVMDFVVAALCDLDLPVMSVQNAASWGYFDTTCNEWNTERLSSSQFPVHLLPIVKAPGCNAGQLKTPWEDVVPSGTVVGVAMGDLPCSTLSAQNQPSDAVVNIGTSAQVVTRTPVGFAPPPPNPTSPVEYFPYFDGGYIAVAASLNGGNVIATFVNMLHEWLTVLGGCEGITKDDIYKRIIKAGCGTKVQDTDLVINPTLFGERHQPDLRASVSNIMTDNLSLGHVTRALCHGIVANLHSMLPRSRMLGDGIQGIVGCGSALLRNKILQEELESVFGFPVVYNTGADAAVGAAKAMAMYQDKE